MLWVILAIFTQLERLAAARAPRAFYQRNTNGRLQRRGQNCFLRHHSPFQRVLFASPVDHGNTNWQTRSGEFGRRSRSVTAAVIWLTDSPVKRDGQVNRWTFQINGLGNNDNRRYAVMWSGVFILDFNAFWLKYGAVVAGKAKTGGLCLVLSALRPLRWTQLKRLETRTETGLFLCRLFRRRHGSGHRQRFDPAEATGEGATRPPTDCSPAAEEPR